MNLNNFFYFAFCISIVFIFSKIYQYNQFVKLSYTKQRLEAKRDSFIKDKDSLQIDLFKAKNQDEIMRYAKSDLNFKALDSSSIVQLDKQ